MARSNSFRKGQGKAVKLSELISQLQSVSNLVAGDTEVFFSESYESKAFHGDRLPCGRENVTLHEVHGVIGFDYEKNEDVHHVLILGDVLYPDILRQDNSPTALQPLPEDCVK
jgi:hypothetical protein